MIKKYRFLIAIIIAGCLAVGIYCNIGVFNKGSLSLNLTYSTDKQNADIGTRLPEINKLIDSYEIFLNGPFGEKATFKADNKGTLFIDNLVSGEWLVTATAVNIDKIPVGSSNASIKILPRKNVDFKINLSPYDEIGSLKLSISCEPLLAKSVSIKGSLDPSIGSGSSIDFTLSGNTKNYKNTSIHLGYYILTIKLFNKSILCGGAADIVGIVSNKAASASIQISASSAKGGAELIFVPQMKDAVEIVLKDTVHSLNQGSSFKITALPVKTKDVIYSWFIDGVLKESGPNYNCFNIPCNLTKGHHRADVAIFTIDGLTGGSAVHNFEVL
jgi:hypothetical protein